MNADNALAQLREGNSRFVDAVRNGVGLRSRSDESIQYAAGPAGAGGQKPFAAILGCADSRVPPELIFDAGFGELFVIRIAGNVVTLAVIESVVYAATHLGTELVVVMGHSHCGAVTATVEDCRRGCAEGESELPDATTRIRKALPEHFDPDAPGALDDAIHANTQHSAGSLRDALAYLSQDARPDSSATRVVVTSAHYTIDTGEVRFAQGVQ